MNDNMENETRYQDNGSYERVGCWEERGYGVNEGSFETLIGMLLKLFSLAKGRMKVRY